MNKQFNPIFVAGKLAYLREVPQLRKPIRSFWGTADHPATIRHSRAMEKYNSHIADLKTYHISEDFENYIKDLYPALKENSVLTEGVDFQTVTVEKPFRIEQAIPLAHIEKKEPPPVENPEQNGAPQPITDEDIQKAAENFWHKHNKIHYGKADFDEVKAYYTAGFKDALKRLNVSV